MKNIWKSLVGVLVIALLIIGGIRYTEQEALRVNGTKEDQSLQKAPQIPGYELITSKPEKGVYVYGKIGQSRTYFNEVLVKTPQGQKTFKWKASTKNPGLWVADVEGKGVDDVVMVFITAYGTGLYESEIHVLDMGLIREIPIEDPRLAAKGLITSRVQGQQIIFTAGGKEYRAGLGGASGADYKNPLYGSVVIYNLENNRIIATVTVQNNALSFIGEFTLTYSYKNGRLVPQVTGFKAFE
jgi:hypothetical protein